MSVCAFILSLTVAHASERKWKPLAEDGLHDPTDPALVFLQQPAEALSVLPPSTSGNQVDWMKALIDGKIKPRSHIYPDTKVRELGTDPRSKHMAPDILMKETGEMPMVRFPHRRHTYWLDCSNCHEKPFKSKIGANPINMFQILSGRYCGRCHGAVAFPLTECLRCHSVARKQVRH